MQIETDESSLASDRLVGVAAIAAFIDPSMSLWKMQRLLADGYYPCWREGNNYVASRSAIRARWVEMTSGSNPNPQEPKHEAGDQGEAA